MPVFCLVLISSVYATGEIPSRLSKKRSLEIEKEVNIPPRKVHNIDGVSWATSVSTDDNGNIYWTYMTPTSPPDIVILKKNAESGEIDSATIIEGAENDNNHSEPSIGIDNAGYIHFIGNQHNNSPNYYISSNPGDIHSWVYKGNDLSSGGLEGDHITYQRFFRSNTGTLFCSYRERLTNKWTQGEPAIMLGRYNTETKRWTMIGGQNFCYTDSECNEFCGGEEINKTPLIWDNSGIGGYPDCKDSCDRNTAYQGYKLKAAFDKSNGLHITWNLGKNFITGKNPAEHHTHVMYAFSPDEGNSWYRANGEEISVLPITCETENADQNGDVVYTRFPEGWPLGCETYSDKQTIGNESYMVIGTDNKPIIQCRPKKMDNVYMKWSGDSWLDISSNYNMDGGMAALYSNQNGVLFRVESDFVEISFDDGKSPQRFSFDTPRSWDCFHDQYYTDQTGNLRYYAKDLSNTTAQIVTLKLRDETSAPNKRGSPKDTRSELLDDLKRCRGAVSAIKGFLKEHDQVRVFDLQGKQCSKTWFRNPGTGIYLMTFTENGIQHSRRISIH